jgi:iron(III) transport system substrate-binding protein
MRRAVVCVALLLALSLGTAGAQAKKVVAYTAHEDAIISEMVPRFKAETGYDLEFVKLASGDVVKRVRAEMGNPQCDVIWSIGGEQLEADNDLLEKYTPKEWDKIDKVFKVGTNWLPYTGIVNVFIVNTNLLKDSEMPKGLGRPAEPEVEGKGLLRDP